MESYENGKINGNRRKYYGNRIEIGEDWGEIGGIEGNTIEIG